MRKIFFSSGEYYHIYNRGVDKRITFNNDFDYQRFIKLLFICNSQQSFRYDGIKKLKLSEIDRGGTLVDIGAYILMPNHFHLLVRAKDEGGVGAFMHKLSTAYTMYFNKVNKRTGSLFESTFKSKHINTDEYLKVVYAYIHLNMVMKKKEELDKKGDVLKILHQVLSDYPYSSYFDYQSQSEREEVLILNKSSFPDYFAEAGDFEELLSEAYEYKMLYSDEEYV